MYMLSVVRPERCNPHTDGIFIFFLACCSPRLYFIFRSLILPGSRDLENQISVGGKKNQNKRKERLLPHVEIDVKSIFSEDKEECLNQLQSTELGT